MFLSSSVAFLSPHTHLLLLSTHTHSCAAAKPNNLAIKDLPASQAEELRQSVENYYGEVLKKTEDLKTSACCTAVAPPPIMRDILSKVPDEVISKYYGCGSPFPLDIEGLHVLDLGCGSGRDCYACAALVGPNGSVTGIDMTSSQLAVAEKYKDTYCTNTLGYPKTNLNFVKGRIENLKDAGIQDDSIDLIISNCVINLSPDKASVLKEAYRSLAPGGEMYFSDVYCDRRLPESVRVHPILLGECLGGALYVEDFIRVARSVGFMDPRVLSSNTIDVLDPELAPLLGEAKFYSITYRLFKVPGRIETLCEDYGQACRYKGTMKGSTHAYRLDDHHEFQTGKWYEVCGNTASMVGESWMGKHFEVVGDRDVHYGLFGACGTAGGVAPAAPAAGGSCC
jgi:SAM-dependent methyltransferase